MNINNYKKLSAREKALFVMNSKIDAALFDFIEQLEHGTAGLSEYIIIDMDIERSKDDITGQDVINALEKRGVIYEVAERFEYGLSTIHVEIFNDGLIGQFMKKY